MMCTGSLLFLMLLSRASFPTAFEWHAAGQRPEVTRRAIAGLWKLTPALRPMPIMKEFTVHPKESSSVDNGDDGNNNNNNNVDDGIELLLMLKEDGSFQEYGSDEVAVGADDESMEDSWKRYQEKQRQEKRKAELAALVKGTWDYRDGKLILAADRPSTAHNEPNEPTNRVVKQHQDTLLEGRVVATYETSLGDNPVLKGTDNIDNTTAAATTATTERKSFDTEKRWDTHLTVPKGSVKVGKFFYPKHHPSFFDQPIYNPAKRGAFQLRQILGSLNTNVPDRDTYVEKFQRSDFYNKTFLLTSHPLGVHQPKGSTRWSIKQNKFVQDPSTNKAAKKLAEEVESRPSPIRVMQVRFFQNNTFATIWGAGDVVLRGKFDVMGQDKDSLWMHISRFGFGRSVSGSVFSEGRMLSQDDAKSYWGTIKYQSNETMMNKEEKDDTSIHQQMSTETKDEKAKLEVHGSVLLGASLEPTPVGRFIMRETDENFGSWFDDGEDEDEDDVILPDLSASLSDMNEDEGVDLSSDDAFQ